MGKLIYLLVGLFMGVFLFSGAKAQTTVSADCTAADGYTGQYKCGFNTDFVETCVYPDQNWCWMSFSCGVWPFITPDCNPCAPVCTTTPVRSDAATWSVQCSWNGNAWVYSDSLRTFCPHGCDAASGLCIPEDGAFQCSGTSECNYGDRQCDSSNLYWMPCGDRNKDGCPDWDIGDMTPCPDGCIMGMCLSEWNAKKDTPCPFECNTGNAICAGTGGNYRITCHDSDGDGCKDLKQTPTEGDHCMYGCQGGECKDKPVSCDCTEGQVRCGGSGADYLMPCTEISTGCWSWYYQFTANSASTWKYCPNGCVTGADNNASCKDSPDLNAFLQNPYVPDNNTVAYYSFDDAFNHSNVVDYSGNNRNLTPKVSYGYGEYSGNSKFGGYGYALAPTAVMGYTFNGSLITGSLGVWYYVDSPTPDSSGIFSIQDSGKSSLVGFDVSVTGTAADSSGYTGWNDILFSNGCATPVYAYYFPNYKTAEGWHHVLLTWDKDYITFYLDGARKDVAHNLTIVTEKIPRCLPYSNANSTISLMGSSGPGIFTVDDIFVSNNIKSFNSTCSTLCPGSLRSCTGTGGYEYSVGCRDRRGFGCYEPWNEDPAKVWCGVAGCNDVTGTCITDATQNNCTLYRNYCTGTGGNYQAYCMDFNGDGFTEFNSESQWTFCGDTGCDPVTGQCRPKQDICFTGEQRCLRSLVEDTGFDGLVNCTLKNFGAAYWDWDTQNVSPCSWGCSEDTYPATGLHHAECNAVGGDLLAGQNAVNYWASNFAVAFQGELMHNLIALIVFAAFLGIGALKTGSPTFGFTIGFGAYLVPIVCGWVHPVIIVGLIAIGGWLVFKGVGGMSHG